LHQDLPVVPASLLNLSKFYHKAETMSFAGHLAAKISRPTKLQLITSSSPPLLLSSPCLFLFLPSPCASWTSWSKPVGGVRGSLERPRKGALAFQVAKDQGTNHAFGFISLHDLRLLALQQPATL
jgi:hypothetical protein